ncbi:hypothetical protein F2Q69_00062525 [Brassica cretica]|uniref:Uncharacterized protein n=1 Tax=Brassica cretica TaxID=69181 RepID=A0A8S9RKX6_BRACR|nr:hypothetical protein F2Q69_00062525 [Brassica cretica]
MPERKSAKINAYRNRRLPEEKPAKTTLTKPPLARVKARTPGECVRDGPTVREKREKACKVATTSGGASERLPAPMVPFFVLPFMSSCVLLRSVDSLRLRADLEASTALASPLKFPGCGGSFSSVAPAKLPERGGSYSSIARLGGLAVAVKKMRSQRVPVWIGELVDDSPVVVEEEMVRFAMEGGPTSDSLLDLQVAGFGF